jgi:hypothetical protein
MTDMKHGRIQILGQILFFKLQILNLYGDSEKSYLNCVSETQRDTEQESIGRILIGRIRKNQLRSTDIDELRYIS